MVMARSMVFLVFVFALLSYNMPSYEARKIMSNPEKKDSLLLEDSSTHEVVFPREDQYGSVIQEGQAESTNEKLSTTLNFAERHRVLKPVPSPGVGH